MCPSTSSSPPAKPMKQVRFHERVKIIEIQRVDQILDDMDHVVIGTTSSVSDHTTVTTSTNTNTNADDDLGFMRDVNSGGRSARRAIGNNHLYDMFSVCFSLRNPNISYGSIKEPTAIPFMLFNESSSPNSCNSNSNNDRRWKGGTTFAPSAPVRAPNIDHIIESALIIIGIGNVTPLVTTTAMGANNDNDEDALFSRKNRSWDNDKNNKNKKSNNNNDEKECDATATIYRKRRMKEDFAPVIPLRKMSATFLEEDAERRKSWPGTNGGASDFPL